MLQLNLSTRRAVKTLEEPSKAKRGGTKRSFKPLDY